MEKRSLSLRQSMWIENISLLWDVCSGIYHSPLVHEVPVITSSHDTKVAPCDTNAIVTSTNPNCNNNSNKNAKGEEKPMPALHSDAMYLEQALALDSALINNTVRMTRTGRIRAKKQQLRMAAYLHSQRAASAHCEDIESGKRESLPQLYLAELDTNQNFTEPADSWRKLSSAVDDERGYLSEPETDDSVVEVLRIYEDFDNMATLCSPPPSVLHSTLNQFKKCDEMDTLEAMKTQVDMLTLNEVSRCGVPADAMPRKRRRPSFLIALLDPLIRNKKKQYQDKDDLTLSPKRKPSIERSYGIPLELSPLLQELEDEDLLQSKESIPRSRFRFGSSLSLCSQKSYQIRQRSAIMAGLRKLRRNKNVFVAKSPEKSPEVEPRPNSFSGTQPISPPFFKSPEIRRNSDFATTRNIIHYDHQHNDLALGRMPRTQKCDSGVYVQLTRCNLEGKSAEILSLKENGAKKQKQAISNSDSKGNALGTLMTWLHRKSPDSAESSPTLFRRRASISGRPASRSSRRARSSTRHETKEKEKSKSPDSEDDVFRRNSFSSGRRSFVKKSSKSSLQSDENVKPNEPSLEEMLKNKAAVQAFREFLKSEYSEENLDFWMECENYKGLKSSKLNKAAFKIFTEFLSKSAPREVNIDFETRARTEEKLKHPSQNTFDEPQNCIYTLMKCDSFRRFISSEAFFKLNFFTTTDFNKNEPEIESRKKINFKTSTKKKKSPR